MLPLLLGALLYLKPVTFLVQEVNALFAEISERFNSFQSNNNLSCLSGCGKCCSYPDITCTTLEALPFAYDIYLEGSLEDFKLRLETNVGSTCLLFKSLDEFSNNGFCTRYQDRPSICRMFGAYAYRNKQSVYQLALCSTLKKQHPNPALKENLDSSLTMSYWNQRLQDLEPNLTREQLPINKALLKAIYYLEDYFYFNPYNNLSNGTILKNNNSSNS